MTTETKTKKTNNTKPKKTHQEKKTKTAASAFQLFWGCISLPVVLAGAVSTCWEQEKDEYTYEEEVEEVEEEGDEHEDEYEDERVKTMTTMLMTMATVFWVIVGVW